MTSCYNEVLRIFLHLLLVFWRDCLGLNRCIAVAWCLWPSWRQWLLSVIFFVYCSFQRCRWPSLFRQSTENSIL